MASGVRSFTTSIFATSIGLAAVLALGLNSSNALAAGTVAGTVIDNVAQITFDLGGVPGTEVSNVSSITVVERIDVAVSLQSGQVLVAANDLDQSLLFTVSNTGNGTETFSLAIDSTLTGDDFNPTPAVPPIYFDTDGSGDFTAADIAYQPGSNDPDLPPDASVDILLVNHIPGTVVNGNLGRSQLTATSLTGTGNPGDLYAGAGDGGVDAIIGNSGGEQAVFGEYLVSDIAMAVLKTVAISDPFGNQDPVPGATMTYTVTVEVTNDGIATTATFRDAIPIGTTYTSNTITLNGVSLTDAIDADEGELNTASVPTVVVRLGDLIQADGVQTVVFEVTID
jgi:uncharacterized repeat protein (TIGR01451 family)